MPETDNSPSPMPPSDRPPAVEDAVLRLQALDVEDLLVVAAQLQDAVGRMRDMAFLPKERRFVVLLNRLVRPGPGPAPVVAGPGRRAQSFARQRCALRFEHVRSAQVSGLAQKDKKQVVQLLTISFEALRPDAPEGYITLVLAGGGAIRLTVDCIEAELADVGLSWRTSAEPRHPES